MRLLDLTDYDRNALWTPRLITCDGPGSLPATDDDPTTRYAILSHRWQKDEVTFADVMNGCSQERAGYDKLIGAVRIAQRLGHNYLWMDTCCIDKSSSAELSEAINSMYFWYSKAQVCFAYLADVHEQRDVSDDNDDDGDDSDCSDYENKENEDINENKRRDKNSNPKGLIDQSEWFERGWTLQELLAPPKVLFYNRIWAFVGTRKQLATELSRITRIDVDVLSGRFTVHSQSVATRMLWAAGRKTTREEDLAYCLMGLFSINMALLYGERTNAFRRLQEEIMKQIDDYSLFAWQGEVSGLDDFGSHCPLLAESPSAFRNSGGIVPYQAWEDITPFQMTNRGIGIDLYVGGGGSIFSGHLPCCRRTTPCHVFKIWLTPLGSGQWARFCSNMLESCKLTGTRQRLYFPQDAHSGILPLLSTVPSTRYCWFEESPPSESNTGRLRRLGGLKNLHVANSQRKQQALREKEFRIPVMSAGIDVALLFAYTPEKAQCRAYVVVCIGSTDEGEIGCTFLPSFDFNSDTRTISDAGALDFMAHTLAQTPTMSSMESHDLALDSISVQVPWTSGPESMTVTFRVSPEPDRRVARFTIAAHASQDLSV